MSGASRQVKRQGDSPARRRAPSGAPDAGVVQVDTNDLAEAEHLVSAYVTPVRMMVLACDEPHRTRIRRSPFGPADIFAWEFGYDFSYTAAPPEKITLSRVRSGAMTLDRVGEPAELFGPGQAVAIGALEGRPYSGTFNRSGLDSVSIDRALLNQVAAGPPHGAEPVRLTGSAPASPAANRQLFATMGYLRDAVAGDPQAMQNPLIAGAAYRYLAACMLATFPNTAALEPTAADRRDATPALLRRAIAFIDDNAHTDITIAGIAAAVYITPRALQYMFRSHRDCTPMGYVRRVRLHHAHLDLVNGNPVTATVGAIARRWGFGHPGRFAVRYREVYRESPQATLRR
jgi:AraC-like DNA-binding protein